LSTERRFNADIGFNPLVDEYQSEERPPRLRTEKPTEPRQGMMWLDKVNKRVEVYVGGVWLYLPLSGEE